MRFTADRDARQPARVVYRTTCPAVTDAFTSYRHRRRGWERQVAARARRVGVHGPPVVDHTGRITGFRLRDGDPIPPGWAILDHTAGQLLRPSRYRARADAEELGRTRAPLPWLPGMPTVLHRPVPLRPLVAEFTRDGAAVAAVWRYEIPAEMVGTQWRLAGAAAQGRDAAHRPRPSSAP